MAGLSNDVGIISWTFLNEVVFCLMLINMAEWFSVLLPSAGAAESMYATAGGVLNLYAGYFMPVQKIPWPWKLFYYIDPARFGVQALTPLQFWCSHSCLQGNPGGSQSVDTTKWPLGCQTPFGADGNVDLANGSINPEFLVRERFSEVTTI